MLMSGSFFRHWRAREIVKYWPYYRRMYVGRLVAHRKNCIETAPFGYNIAFLHPDGSADFLFIVSSPELNFLLRISAQVCGRGLGQGPSRQKRRMRNFDLISKT